MTNAIEKVKEFHKAAGNPIPTEATLPLERIELRLDLIQEEWEELIDGVYKKDLIEVADALGDLVYVIIGMALECGIPLDKVFDEIHRSNMTKFDTDGKPIFRVDGKLLKGPNFQPPNLEPILNQEQ